MHHMISHKIVVVALVEQVALVPVQQVLSYVIYWLRTFNVPVNKKSNDTNSKSNKETATGANTANGQKPQNTVTSGQPRKD